MKKRKSLTEKQYQAQQERWQRGEIGVYRTREGEVYAEIQRTDPAVQARMDAIILGNMPWWVRLWRMIWRQTPA